MNLDSIERRAAKHRGMKRSVESKRRMKDAQIQLRRDGLLVSAETKSRMREDRKSRDKQSDETKNKRRESSPRKCPNQYTLGGVFIKKWNSATEAATHFNVGPEMISGCCTGRFKTAVGFKWEYDEPQPIFVRGRAVIQMDFTGTLIKEWPSIRMAARAVGVNPSGIIKCCAQITQSSAGFAWKYK